MLDFGTELCAIEIKLTSAPGPEDMARLDKTADLIAASRRYLVSQTRTPSGDDLRASCDITGVLERLALLR